MTGHLHRPAVRPRTARSASASRPRPGTARSVPCGQEHHLLLSPRAVERRDQLQDVQHDGTPPSSDQCSEQSPCADRRLQRSSSRRRPADRRRRGAMGTARSKSSPLVENARASPAGSSGARGPAVWTPSTIRATVCRGCPEATTGTPAAIASSKATLIPSSREEKHEQVGGTKHHGGIRHGARQVDRGRQAEPRDPGGQSGPLGPLTDQGQPRPRVPRVDFGPGVDQQVESLLVREPADVQAVGRCLDRGEAARGCRGRARRWVARWVIVAGS